MFVVYCVLVLVWDVLQSKESEFSVSYILLYEFSIL